MKKRKKNKMKTAKSYSVVDTEQDTWISTTFPERVPSPQPKDNAPNRKDRNPCTRWCCNLYNTIKSFLCRIITKNR